MHIVTEPLSAFTSLQTVGYGHLGDGNLHLNVAVPAGAAAEVRWLLRVLGALHHQKRG